MKNVSFKNRHLCELTALSRMRSWRKMKRQGADGKKEKDADECVKWRQRKRCENHILVIYLLLIVNVMRYADFWFISRYRWYSGVLIFCPHLVSLARLMYVQNWSDTGYTSCRAVENFSLWARSRKIRFEIRFQFILWAVIKLRKSNFTAPYATKIVKDRHNTKMTVENCNLSKEVAYKWTQKNRRNLWQTTRYQTWLFSRNLYHRSLAVDHSSSIYMYFCFPVHIYSEFLSFYLITEHGEAAQHTKIQSQS